MLFSMRFILVLQHKPKIGAGIAAVGVLAIAGVYFFAINSKAANFTAKPWMPANISTTKLPSKFKIKAWAVILLVLVTLAGGVVVCFVFCCNGTPNEDDQGTKRRKSRSEVPRSSEFASSVQERDRRLEAIKARIKARKDMGSNAAQGSASPSTTPLSSDQGYSRPTESRYASDYDTVVSSSVHQANG